MTSLSVGGMTPLTTVDFPGQLSAVVFCQGCPFACPYCHNPHLIPTDATPYCSWEEVVDFLSRRVGLLDAVVFSGGEPTLQRPIVDALSTIKSMGFLVGMHTAGPIPSRLEEALPFLDWVGMDIKTTFDKYPSVTGVKASGAKARASARLIIQSNVAYQFRTTVHPLLHSEDDILSLADDLAMMGGRCFALQRFRSSGCCDAALCSTSTIDFPSENICSHLSSHFVSFSLS